MLGRLAAVATCAAALAGCATTTQVATRTVAVATTSRCPHDLPDAPPVAGNARVDMVLVPIAAIRVDVCVYRAGTLSATATVDGGAEADTIESAANTLQGQDPTSNTLCTSTSRDRYLVLFSDGLHSTGVGAASAACSTVTNGFLSATPTPAWRAALVRLLARTAA